MRLEKRMRPAEPALIAAARENPGGWVYDIDWQFRPEQAVPPEAIRGSWEVDPAGNLTGQFAPNPNYRPIRFETRPLKQYMHDAAKANPGEWVVEIDEAAEHLFPNIPKSKRRGWWYVDEYGTITRKFRENASYRAEE